MADLGSGNDRDPAYEASRIYVQVCSSPRTSPETYLGCSLSLVWPGLHAACDGRVNPEILLHRISATVLDRSAALDDAGDRGGPTLGRVFEGVSHERARCLRPHSAC